MNQTQTIQRKRGYLESYLRTEGAGAQFAEEIGALLQKDMGDVSSYNATHDLYTAVKRLRRSDRRQRDEEYRKRWQGYTFSYDWMSETPDPNCGLVEVDVQDAEGRRYWLNVYALDYLRKELTRKNSIDTPPNSRIVSALTREAIKKSIDELIEEGRVEELLQRYD